MNATLNQEVTVDFDNFPNTHISVGEELDLGYFIVHHISSKTNAKIGVERANVQVPGMAEGQALILAKSQSGDTQETHIVMSYTVSSIRFALTELHFEATIGFYNGDVCLETRTLGSGRRRWIDFEAPEGEHLTRMEITVRDHTYIDFVTLNIRHDNA
ncbi:hypothetical protein ODI84_18740 [Pseudomonas putida]|uniref:Uncharacterized protein n=1 Tax=Pseudomonas putida TaxID=303 RepID=A0A1X1A1F9_PSEPU|nr:hypothetical protein [Pseudomonas putida]MEB3902209.1 hypothetical protein [Pseudomonas putida]ORL65682.1 hypothetical protein B7H17_07290 [Pseudomonas putida]